MFLSYNFHYNVGPTLFAYLTYECMLYIYSRLIYSGGARIFYRKI